MRFTFRFSRSICGALAASLIVLLGLTPAVAANFSVTVLGLERGSTANVILYDDALGKSRSFRAGIILLSAHEGYVYCVDIDQPIAENAGVDDADWGQYPKPNSGFGANAKKISSVLSRGYPNTSLQNLQQAAGVDEKHTLAAWQVASATQLAVWRFSNDVKLDMRNEIDTKGRRILVGQGSETERSDLKKVYDYLVDGARDIEQPPAALHIDSDAAVRTSSGLIGPITVSTTAAFATLTVKPSGVGVTDRDGKPLREVAKGSHDVYLDVSEGAGSAVLAASAVANVQLGRLFVGVSLDTPTQPMVLAKSTDMPLTRSTKVDWKAISPPITTPASQASPPSVAHESAKNPEPTVTTKSSVSTGGENRKSPDDKPLASTGVTILWVAVLGVVLVALGVFILFLRRRGKVKV